MHAKSVDRRTEAERIAAALPPLLLEASALARSVAAGLHGRRQAGPGETFWQHRDYAAGDPVSSIDWRQSARSANRYHVRQNEWENAGAVWIWRDGSASFDYASDKSLPTKRSRADVLATALAILLSDGGERVGLLTDERRLHRGRHAPQRILEGLLQDGMSEPAPPPPSRERGATAYAVFSDFFTPFPELTAAIETLASTGANGVLIHVSDPAEIEFPFHGRISFRDPESRDARLFGDAGSVSADYRALFADLRDRLDGLASRVGWRSIHHRTDTPATTALMAIHESLANRAGG